MNNFFEIKNATFKAGGKDKVKDLTLSSHEFYKDFCSLKNIFIWTQEKHMPLKLSLSIVQMLIIFNTEILFTITDILSHSLS